MAENEGGALRELLAVFGFKVDTHELKKGESGLENFLGSVKRIAGGIAAAFAIHEIFEFAEANVRAMSEIERAAAQLGTSTEQIQKYQLASRSLGMEADGLTMAMTRMQVAQEASSTATDTQKDGFHMLGVSIRDTATGKMKGVDQLFLDVADAISKQTDQTKIAAATVHIFGRAGGQLLPLLKRGKAGFEELTAAFAEMGGGYSEAALEASKKYEGQTAKLTLAITSLKSKAMEALLPILGKIVGWITKGVNWFRVMSRDSRLLEVSLGALGVAATSFAVAMAIANAPIILIAAAIGGLVILVDDLIGMFEGKESLIGDTIDSIFGKDAHVDAIKALGDAWGKVRDVFKELAPYMETVGKFLKESYGRFNKVEDFGAKTLANVLGEHQLVGTPSVSHGRGGLDDRENLHGLNAQKMLNAQLAGKDTSGMKLDTAPGDWLHAAETQEQARKAAMEMIPKILAGGFPQFQPQATQNLPPVEIHQVISGTAGMNTKELADHAAAAAEKVIKRRHRAAAATLQRKADSSS